MNKKLIIVYKICNTLKSIDLVVPFLDKLAYLNCYNLFIVAKVHNYS